MSYYTRALAGEDDAEEGCDNDFRQYGLHDLDRRGEKEECRGNLVVYVRRHDLERNSPRASRPGE